MLILDVQYYYCNTKINYPILVFFLNFFLDKTLSMIYFLRIAVFNMSFKEIPSNKSFVAYITGKWLVLVVGQFMLLEIRFVVKNTMTNTALKKNTLTAYKSIVSRCLEMYYNEGCHISCVITFSWGVAKPCADCMCVSRLELHLKARSHSVHGYAFSSLWVFMCAFRLETVAKLRQHTSHSLSLNSPWKTKSTIAFSVFKYFFLHHKRKQVLR